MRAGHQGFTLIESVIVVVVLAIMSTTVMISLNAGRQHAVVVQADELRRAISHAQLIAISQGVRLRLTTTSTSYTVSTCSNTACSTTSALIDPATGSTFTTSFASENVTLSGGPLDFDSMGRPQSSGSLLSSTTTFSFAGGGNTVTVSVLPLTGFAIAS